jgi:hypothetical protein
MRPTEAIQSAWELAAESSLRSRLSWTRPRDDLIELMPVATVEERSCENAEHETDKAMARARNAIFMGSLSKEEALTLRKTP